MMLKRALSSGDDFGAHLLTPGRPSMTKTAGMVPLVEEFISTLRPDPRYMYTLVNAMGYSEFYGANSNRDYYGYNPHLDFNGLLHTPDTCCCHGEYHNWQCDSLVQARLAKAWPFGYPSFYGAAVYAHHKNTDPSSLGFGDVIYAAQNEAMKRVELVMRVDIALAAKRGHSAILDRIKRGERTDVSMGCFRAGAMVTMADGTRKPIEQIVVGDSVRTHTGGTGRVTELHRRRYKGEFFEIRPANEDPFVATTEHPFWAAFRAKDAQRVWQKDKPTFDWVFAKDLEGAVLSRPKVTNTVASDISRATARILGYYLAEGHIVLNKNGDPAGIELTVNKNDAANEEIEALCQEVRTRNAPVWRQRENSEQEFAIGIYDAGLASLCASICGRFSKTKKLDESVLYWPEDLQRELLGAYFNGDGFTSGGDLLCSTASEDLAHQIREILFRLGVPTSYQVLHHRAGSGKSTKDTFEWVISIGKQWAGTFAPYCAKAPVTEIGKAKNIYRDYGDLWAVPIREYSSFFGEDDVYNFEVEGDNSYVVNGVAAHNCKVPFDNCSICTDWDTMKVAWKGYDKRRHASPGVAILAYHRTVRPIRGLAVTKADYCFPRGTLITMASGDQVAIEDVRVGDGVLAHDGSFREVTQLLPSTGLAEAVLVHAWGFTSQLSTENHPYLVQRGLRTGVPGGRAAQMSADTLEWVPAAELLPTDVVLSPVRSLPLESTTPTELGWLLGLYLAEGSPRYSAGVAYPSGTAFSLHEKEAALAERIERAAQLMDPKARCAVYRSNGAGITVRLASRQVSEWLEHCGGRGSSTKCLHPCVFQQSVGFCRAVLAGWAQGDGSHDKDMGVLRVATSSERLSRQMQNLAASCGVLAALHLYERPTNFKYQRIWYISFSGDAADAIQECREQQHFSKQSKLFFWDKYLCTSVRAVVPAGHLEEKYNFEVEGAHSYVAGGYAVHNCEHMVNTPGAILPDGQKVFVYNDFPKFFDISFVWVGADRTARVMWYMGDTPNLASMPSRPTSISEMLKGASDMTKTASVERTKGAEMEKEIPGGIARKIELCSNSEMDLPFGPLAEFSKLFGARTLLSTLGGLGVPLKPQEFHAVISVERPLHTVIAKKAAEEGVTFRTDLPGHTDRYAVDPEAFSPKLAEELLPLLDARSSFGPHLHVRLASSQKTASAGVRQSMEDPFARDVAADYNGYRLSLLKEAGNLFPKYYTVVATAHSDLLKTASSASLLLSPHAVVHWISAHLDKVASVDRELAEVMKYVTAEPDYRKLSAIGIEVGNRMDSQTGFLDAFKKAVNTVL